MSLWVRALLLAMAAMAGCGDDGAPERPDADGADAHDSDALLDSGLHDVGADVGQPLVPTDCGASRGTPRYGYRVVSRYPHDPSAFTQGLVYRSEADQQVLYEGTGLVGRSSLRRVLLESGEVTRMTELERPFFGEGIVIWDGSVTQLTWQGQVGFRYDLDTFERVGMVAFETEGWGLTHNGRQLIMSDGTNRLTFRDPSSFAALSSVLVTLDGEPVRFLNELEYVNGLVWANVWQTDEIVLIEPSSGDVVGVVKLSGLLESAHPDYRGADVLNGIAFDEVSSRIFVTGKLWPSVFELRLVCDET